MRIPSLAKTLKFLVPVLAISLLALCIPAAAGAQSLQGAWQGTLHTPGGDLPLEFDFAAGGSGTLTSFAQGASMPITYSTTGNNLTVTARSVGGVYSGTVSGNQITGTWTQNGTSLPLALAKGAPTPASSSIQGDWQGTLHTPSGNLPVIATFGNGGAGVMRSPTQGFTGPLQYSLTGQQLTFVVPSIGGTYKGTLSGKQIIGVWSQNGAQLPLTLSH